MDLALLFGVQVRTWSPLCHLFPCLSLFFPILPHLFASLCRLASRCSRTYQPALADISQQIHFFACLVRTYQYQCAGHGTVDNQMCYCCFLPHRGLADTPHQTDASLLPCLSTHSFQFYTCCADMFYVVPELLITAWQIVDTLHEMYRFPCLAFHFFPVLHLLCGS